MMIDFRPLDLSTHCIQVVHVVSNPLRSYTIEDH